MEERRSTRSITKKDYLEMEEGEIRHADLCLFCLRNLPPNWKDLKSLETVICSGSEESFSLSVRLDDKAKNSHSFDFLCERLCLSWDDKKGWEKVDKGECLPLCIQCQHVFQEAYQLQLQVCELAKLIKQRMGFISDSILDSEKLRSPEKVPSFELCGLQQFREKVVSKTRSKNPLTSSKSQASTSSNSNNTPISPVIPEAIVKMEHIQLEETDTIEDWMGEGNFDDLSNLIDEEDDPLDDDWGEEDDMEDEDWIGENTLKEEKPTLKKSKNPVKKNQTQKQPSVFSRPPGERDYTCVCHICDATMIDKMEFFKHYDEFHPEEKRYSCRFCQKHFKRLRECHVHQWSTHTGERPFKCTLCEKAYQSKETRRMHLKYAHGTGGVGSDGKLLQGVGEFPCLTCGKICETQMKLKWHEALHDETVVVCKSCGATLKTRTFYRHNKRNHEGQAECTEPMLNPSEETLQSLQIPFQGQSNKTQNSWPRCHVCWKTVGPAAGLLKKHFVEVHNRTNMLQCAVCEKICKSYKETRKHAYRHLDERNEICDKCELRFKTKEELRSHQKVHLAEEDRPKFICDTCGGVYSSKCHLSTHRKIHEEGYQPMKWVCEICGKSYNYRKGYLYHKRSIHLGDKPEKCPHCEKCFVAKGELQKHLVMHLADKPFKCELCDKRFSFQHTAKRHVKEVHEGVKERYRTGGGSRKKMKMSPGSTSDDFLAQIL